MTNKNRKPHTTIGVSHETLERLHKYRDAIVKRLDIKSMSIEDVILMLLSGKEKPDDHLAN